MANPVRKPDEPSRSSDGLDLDRSATDETPALAPPTATGSPALDLQAKLHKQLSRQPSKLSARFITWLVIATCAGTWLAGVGLYSTL
ncbi:MAG: hypothetical protein AAF296_10610 [Pseudomonadota bacterium]